MEKEFKAKLSPAIAAIYWGAFVFEILVMIFIPTLSPMPLEAKAVFYGVFSLVIIMFIFILYKVYHMKFKLSQGMLYIHGVFRTNKVEIKNIKDIKKSPIPFGMRLFGGSFIGGYYYLPGIGRAWVAMTNFKDGVLITTRDKENYIITPTHPKQFIEDINKLISK